MNFYYYITLFAAWLSSVELWLAPDDRSIEVATPTIITGVLFFVLGVKKQFKDHKEYVFYRDCPKPQVTRHDEDVYENPKKLKYSDPCKAEKDPLFRRTQEWQMRQNRTNW